MEAERNEKARYKATTINGEPHLEPVNPYTPCWEIDVACPSELEGACDCNAWSDFAKDNPPFPYIGPALPDGTIVQESEVEFKDQYYKLPLWRDTNGAKLPWNAHTRRVATLKVKEICTVNCKCQTSDDCHGDAALNLVELHDSKRSFQEDYDHENGQYVNKCFGCNSYFMGHKRRVTCKSCEISPSNSEEGEQPMKEESINSGVREREVQKPWGIDMEYECVNCKEWDTDNADGLCMNCFEPNLASPQEGEQGREEEPTATQEEAWNEFKKTDVFKNCLSFEVQALFIQWLFKGYILTKK